MGDLISREALLENYDLKNAEKYGNKTEEQRHNSYSTLMLYEVADMIRDAPAVEESSPCEGEWQNTGKLEEWYSYMYKCSKCGNETLDSGKFCSNCGAKMEEVEEVYE